jgi:hypothetical protein
MRERGEGVSEWRDLPPPPDPDQPGWDPTADDLLAQLHPEPPDGPDPVAVIAVTAGFIGIVFFGIVLAIVASVLGTIAGQRAREAGKSFDLAYLAFGLAAIDGIVWIVMQLLFEVPITVG